MRITTAKITIDTADRWVELEIGGERYTMREEGGKLVVRGVTCSLTVNPRLSNEVAIGPREGA